MASIFAVGVPRFHVYGHDVFLALDGGWRVLHGQRPAVDFYAEIGPLWHGLAGFGLWMSGGAARGIGYASTLVAAILAAWSWLLLRGQMPRWVCGVACASVVLLACAPYVPGFYPWDTTTAESYNRYGYALTALVVLEISLADRAPAWRGLSSGLAVGLLVFLKVSFGLVAVLLLGISLFTATRGGKWVAGWALGVALVFGFFWLWLGDLGSVLAEYRYLAASRAGSLGPGVVRFFFGAAYQCGLFLAATIAVGWTSRRLVLVIAVLVTDILLLATNNQGFELPLMGIATLSYLAAAASAGNRTAILLALLAAGIRPTIDAISVTWALSERIVRPHATATLGGLEFFNSSQGHVNDNGEPLVRYTEAGIDLLRRHGLSHATVMGTGVSNPFPFLLGAPPVRGGSIGIDSTQLPKTGVAAPRNFLGNPEALLVPKYDGSQRMDMSAVLESQRAWTQEHYVIAEETSDWILLTARKP